MAVSQCGKFDPTHWMVNNERAAWRDESPKSDNVGCWHLTDVGVTRMSALRHPKPDIPSTSGFASQALPRMNRLDMTGQEGPYAQPLSAVTTTSIKAPPPRSATPTVARAGRLSPKNSVQTASISFFLHRSVTKIDALTTRDEPVPAAFR